MYLLHYVPIKLYEVCVCGGGEGILPCVTPKLQLQEHRD